MNSLIVFCFVAVCAASAMPAFEHHQEKDGFLRNRRSFSETEFENGPSFLDEQLRQSRSVPEAEVELTLEGGEEHGTRLKRATCDLLSLSMSVPFLRVNHSACAMHCIARGFRDGRCIGAVCNCRY